MWEAGTAPFAPIINRVNGKTMSTFTVPALEVLLTNLDLF